jgi:gas vesicle protein
MKFSSFKILYIFLLVLFISSGIAFSQDSWKSVWEETITELDSTFNPIRRHFRLMQTYQNEATEELILADIDSLKHFIVEVNSAIGVANKLILPDTENGRNAAETIRLKIEALKEYTEQCKLQIEVNNRILQKKLKNESLDFKVSQISDIMSEIRQYPEPENKKKQTLLS